MRIPGNRTFVISIINSINSRRRPRRIPNNPTTIVIWSTVTTNITCIISFTYLPIIVKTNNPTNIYISIHGTSIISLFNHTGVSPCYTTNLFMVRLNTACMIYIANRSTVIIANNAANDLFCNVYVGIHYSHIFNCTCVISK